MRPALPLSAQLLLSFVGLLMGITVVLTRTAYTSLAQADAQLRDARSTADRGEAGLSDSDRAVRDGAERTDARVPGIVQGEAGAVRGELHRDGVQRADTAEAGLRVRAGYQA